MKKIFLSILVILAATTQCFAERGVLTNIFASWTNVTTTAKNIPFPAPSRDITIMNGSTSDVCVALKSNATMEGVCDATNNLMQLDGGQSLFLQDIITDGIGLVTLTGTASPVSVVVTY